MLREIDWRLFYWPNHRELLKAFYETGEDPGEFLEGVLKNDLQRVMLRLEGEHWLPDVRYVSCWLYAHMPAMAYGSASRYDDWRKRGGRQGRLKEQLLSAPVARRVVGDEKTEQPVDEQHQHGKHGVAQLHQGVRADGRRVEPWQHYRYPGGDESC